MFSNADSRAMLGGGRQFVEVQVSYGPDAEAGILRNSEGISARDASPGVLS